MSDNEAVIVSDDDSNDPPSSPCPDCTLFPCIFQRECLLLDTYMEELFLKQENGTYIRAKDNAIVNNDELRFTAYRLTTDWIAPYIRTGNRRRLTACIIREILQRWPLVDEN